MTTGITWLVNVTLNVIKCVNSEWIILDFFMFTRGCYLNVIIYNIIVIE